MPGAKHLTINDADTRLVFRLGLDAVRVSSQAPLTAESKSPPKHPLLWARTVDLQRRRQWA